MRRTGDGELAVSGMDCRLMSMLALDGVIPREESGAELDHGPWPPITLVRVHWEVGT